MRVFGKRHRLNLSSPLLGCCPANLEQRRHFASISRNPPPSNSLRKSSLHRSQFMFSDNLGEEIVPADKYQRLCLAAEVSDVGN